MVIILMISTAISAFMGEITEAVTIIAIVTINALLGFIQEYRTERTMEALKSLTAPEAKVIRTAGRSAYLPARWFREIFSFLKPGTDRSRCSAAGQCEHPDR